MCVGERKPAVVLRQEGKSGYRHSRQESGLGRDVGQPHRRARESEAGGEAAEMSVNQTIWVMLRFSA